MHNVDSPDALEVLVFDKVNMASSWKSGVKTYDSNVDILKARLLHEGPVISKSCYLAKVASMTLRFNLGVHLFDLL